MRFVSLSVNHFNNIASATVEFGPGLNILYGPNELGKSSLVEALGAALLLQTSSKAYEKWRPWGSDAQPEVELVFTTEPERYYKLFKVFDAKGGQSTLHESRDNVSYSMLSRGREVDGVLRDLLHWGIPEPGRGAPRGMPTSFLCTVLLTPQNNPTQVFTVDLNDDPEESGKKLLIGALQAMGSDPLLKKVLSAAQPMVDKAFTPKGSRRRGKGSPWEEMRIAINEINEALDAMEKAAQQNSQVREHLRTLYDRCRELGVNRDALAVRVKNAEKALAELGKLQEQAATAREQLEHVAELQTRRNALQSRIQQSEQEREALRHGLDEKRQAATRMNEALRQAEDRLRQLRNEEAQAAVEQRRRQLETQVKTAEVTIREQNQILASAQRLDELNRQREARRAEIGTRQDAHEQAVAAMEQLLQQQRDTQDRLAAMEQVVRWLALRRCEAELHALREQENTRLLYQRQADDLQNESDKLKQALDACELPTSEELEQMRKLHQDREIARKSLAVGLSVQVEPLTWFKLNVQRDDEASAETSLTVDPVTFSAERGMDLEILEYARISIRGGSAALRKKADALDKRWRAEAQPVLKKAGVKKLKALVEAVREREDREREWRRLCAELQVLREKAQAPDQAAEKMQTAQGRLDAAEQALGACDRMELALAGEQDQSTAEQERDVLRAALTRLQNRITEQRIAMGRGELELAHLNQAVDELQQALEAGAADFDQPWPDAAEAATTCKAEAEQQLSAAREALNELETKRGEGLVEAETVLQCAQAELDAANKSVEKKQQALYEKNNALSRDRGWLAGLDEQWTQADYEGKRRQLDQLDAAVKALKEQHPGLTEQYLAELRRQLDEDTTRLRNLKQDIYKEEGGLERTGGSGDEARLKAYREARTQREEEERRNEIDYEAWKLLHETAIEVEREQAQHLGKAVIQPIRDRFIELTGKAYGSLDLSPSLKTRGILVDGICRDVRQLSLGTQEQLATLLRLVLAENLKSAVVLDDQLVHTDSLRLAWFRQWLMHLAQTIQILVLTCRREDYPAAPTAHLVNLSNCINNGHEHA